MPLCARPATAPASSDCVCPKTCTCKDPDLTDPKTVIGEIHGDCPIHGDDEVKGALCPAKVHWWEVEPIIQDNALDEF